MERIVSRIEAPALRAARERSAAEFFRTYFEPDWRQALVDISTIAHHIPRDRAMLFALMECCRHAARSATRMGRHLEVRRLNDLAAQLNRLASNGFMSPQ
jgi:hypothetical protein